MKIPGCSARSSTYQAIRRPASATQPLPCGTCTAAARSFQPGLILASHHYSDLQGWFVAGDGDRSSRAAVHSLVGEASAAGIDAHTFEASGGHTWAFARRAFTAIYPEVVTALSEGANGPGP